MSSASTLNTFAAPQWVKVVHGTPWKAHIYDPETGALSAELMRGISAIFAKGFGEGASLTPLLHFLRNALEAGQDDPSPTDPVAWNNRAHFAALAWAARNKVRHSVRWKTGARIRRARKLDALRRARDTARQIQRRAEGRTGLQGQPADRTAKGRRAAARQWWESEGYYSRLSEFAPAPATEENPDGIDLDRHRDLLHFMGTLHLKARRGGPVQPIGLAGLWAGDAPARFAAFQGDKQALRGFMRCVNECRMTLAFTVALRALQSAAYRAHLARRVRPPVRRTRARRPLYARPRPPTAPLAPPVA